MTRRIEWVDTDASGHHHHSVVARHVEAAEAELVRELGLDGYFGQTPRVRFEVDFLERVVFGETLTTGLEVDALGRTSLTYRFTQTILRDGQTVVVARGRLVVVHVPSLAVRSSQPWPVAWRERLETLSAPGSPDGSG